jgi:hypothetical protein
MRSAPGERQARTCDEIGDDPRHQDFVGLPLAIMAQAMRAMLLASAMAATFAGRRPNNAVSQGRCLVPWILACG